MTMTIESVGVDSTKLEVKLKAPETSAEALSEIEIGSSRMMYGNDVLDIVETNPESVYVQFQLARIAETSLSEAFTTEVRVTPALLSHKSTEELAEDISHQAFNIAEKVTRDVLNEVIQSRTTVEISAIPDQLALESVSSVENEEDNSDLLQKLAALEKENLMLKATIAQRNLDIADRDRVIYAKPIEFLRKVRTYSLGARALTSAFSSKE